MKYGIIRNVIGFGEMIELPEQTYKEIKQAAQKGREALLIEERFNMLLENYIEYENILSDIGIRYMLYSDFFDSFDENRRNISRLLANLLSACRLYLDATAHSLKFMYGKNSSQLRAFRSETNKQYDGYLSYRVMEALRNVVQHRGLPSYTIRYNSQQPENETATEYTIMYHLGLDDLENDDKFKREVIRDLGELERTPDVKTYVREYIECLGNIHGFVRDLIRTDKEMWDRQQHLPLSLLQEEFGSDVSDTAIEIVTENDDQLEIEHIPIVLRHIIQREELERKNGHFENLATRHLTSKSFPNKLPRRARS